MRVVQVWFQNQRAKMKKIQRKAKQENEKNCDKIDNNESDMKQENIGSDHSKYIYTFTFKAIFYIIYSTTYVNNL